MSLKYDTYLLVSDGGKMQDDLMYGSFSVFNPSGNFEYNKKFILGIGTNNRAEYMSLIHGLNWCLENNILKVKAMTDSKVVINQVYNIWKCNDKTLKKYKKKVEDLMLCFNTIHLCYMNEKQVKNILGH